ncbi:glycoside hydrolase family 172 protein [Pedobacter sp. SYP-B3415]|uniref:glycoside hydrolase family 172 protein n=1 Tax=Pedobacter sp. SYP-B3415 TaxID=2496641 RepID=UPI00101BA1E2|nr:glycoside hydrolase family 172 protein [Pedobacter sp. SYP-B3415]
MILAFLKRTLFFIVVPFTLYAQEEISVLTELDELTQFSRLPTYRDKSSVLQFSSYDRTGNNDDGFSGKYSFIRKEKDSSLVIFEAKGKGVINRIWTPTPTDDLVDFYFDGAKKPALSIRFSDLFSGTVAPFVAPLTGNQVGGYFCYLPIPFSNGCKIVFRGKKLEFYQIQYRTLPSAAKVRTFNAAEKALPGALEQLAKTWSAVRENLPALKDQSLQTINFDQQLPAGGSVVLAALDKPGRIVGIELEQASAYAGLNRQADLKISWDGDPQPAVYAPVADFFGYAFGQTSMQSLLLGSRANMNYCYFPMPFAGQARVELLSRKPDSGLSENLRVKGRIYVLPQGLDPAKEGRFYAFRNREQPTRPGQPHLFLEGKGKGHYAGTILQAQGLEPGMTLFFEGDDQTTADGKLTIHGTGSEDYFNGGWYALLDRWDRKMSLPLHGSLDYSLPFARTGGYRLFLTDKIPFNQSFRHTIEHGPENNNKRGDYTSMAFYYADKPLATSEQPSNRTTGTYLPDTMVLYPQLMNFSFNGAMLMDGETITAKNGGAVRIDLQEFPSGQYKLFADADDLPDGAELTVWQRQSRVSKDLSFQGAVKKAQHMRYLCDIVVDDFRNSLTFHFKRDQQKNKLHLRRLILVKKKNQ